MRAGDGFERYPRPALSRQTRAFTRAFGIGIGVVTATVGAVLVASRIAEGSLGEAFFSAAICGTIALLAFGVVPQSHPKAQFRYLNSIVMTHAEQPTADSWVHVAPTRVMRMTLLLGLMCVVLAAAGCAVFAGAQVFGFIPQVNEDVSEAGPLLGMVFFAVLTGVGGWIVYLLLARRVRAGGHGSRPSGVALGETSVAVRVPGRDVEILWTDIVAVDALALEQGRGQEIPMIRLTLRSGGPLNGVQMLAADGYTVPTDALFTALRWYHAHPEARRELGRVEGQRRIEGWRKDALQRQ